MRPRPSLPRSACRFEASSHWHRSDAEAWHDPSCTQDKHGPKPMPCQNDKKGCCLLKAMPRCPGNKSQRGLRGRAEFWEFWDKQGNCLHANTVHGNARKYILNYA